MRRLTREFKRFYSKKYNVSEFAKILPESVPPTASPDEWSNINSVPELTEQKEELIFKEVLGQVLSSKRPESKTPMSDSILALFERPAEADKQEKSKSPVESLLDGLLNPKVDSTILHKENQKREQADAILVNVYAHIDALPTNGDVTSYFEQTVVPAFDPQSAASETQVCSGEKPIVNTLTASYILEKCIKSLAIDFKDPVSAIHLFEVAKHHSVQLFTDACSANVYNQIIRIRWYEYRDLYAVVNLAAEIAVNAIPPNLETTELLSKVYRDAMDSSKGVATSDSGMPLWTRQDDVRVQELNRYRMRFQSSWASST